MNAENSRKSLEDLRHIREMMDRSARFLSLSGWSGVWAGAVALVSSFVAHGWIKDYRQAYDGLSDTYRSEMLAGPATKLIGLAVATFVVALMGALYFTYAKNRKSEHGLWNAASLKLVVSLAIPVAAGAVFCLVFFLNNDPQYVSGASLAFYGLALINSSKYTFPEIRYLGLCEVLTGCICLFFPYYGLYFWAFGFGVLHIVYGLIMWNNHKN